MKTTPLIQQDMIWYRSGLLWIAPNKKQFIQHFLLENPVLSNEEFLSCGGMNNLLMKCVDKLDINKYKKE